jgi:steroid delta-isomerase-like uncharacterized protein
MSVLSGKATGVSSNISLQASIGQWIEAFNTHNVAAIVALYGDNAELFDAGMKRPRRGRAEIERWFQSRFHTMPSITYMPSSQILLQENMAAITWTTQGNGPRLLNLPFFSRPIHVDGVSVFTFVDGLIQKQRGYYDHLAVLEQVFPPLKWLALPRL